MKTVAITGSDGFIGRNLYASLCSRTDLRILRYDVGQSREEMLQGLASADFVFHLAGVNRPKDQSEFGIGNQVLTEKIVETLLANGRKTGLLLSSSIQAELSNPYGQSKKAAETAVFSYSAKSGGETFVFRLPNVFGKWCRPNYNSVIATWCYNKARDLPIQINDPAVQLPLVYIDDVVASFISALDGKAVPDGDGFCRVPTTYRKSLSEIAAMLDSFSASRTTLVLPALDEEFARRLYATWLSYLPTDGFGYPLEMKKDDRGWLSEFIKSNSFGQIFVSRTKPGITRGNHWHHTKVEKFLVLEGSAMIRFRRIDTGKTLEYPVDGDKPQVVDIPAGYTHSITNIGSDDLLTLFWASEIFDPSRPDTYFLEV